MLSRSGRVDALVLKVFLHVSFGLLSDVAPFVEPHLRRVPKVVPQNVGARSQRGCGIRIRYSDIKRHGSILLPQRLAAFVRVYLPAEEESYCEIRRADEKSDQNRREQHGENGSVRPNEFRRLRRHEEQAQIPHQKRDAGRFSIPLARRWDAFSTHRCEDRRWENEACDAQENRPGESARPASKEKRQNNRREKDEPQRREEERENDVFDLSIEESHHDRRGSSRGSHCGKKRRKRQIFATSQVSNDEKRDGTEENIPPQKKRMAPMERMNGSRDAQKNKKKHTHQQEWDAESQMVKLRK